MGLLDNIWDVLTGTGSNSVAGFVRDKLIDSGSWRDYMIRTVVYEGVKWAWNNSGTLQRNIEQKILGPIINEIKKISGIDLGFLTELDDEFTRDLLDIIETIKSIPAMIRKIGDYYDFSDLTIIDDLFSYIDEEFNLLTGQIDEFKPKTSWYNGIINYASHRYKTPEGEKRSIEYYETIKIRKQLSYFTEKQGFPVKFAHDLNFTMFIGLRVPTGWTVHKLKTIELWNRNRSSRWREVMINYRGAEFTSFAKKVLTKAPAVGWLINGFINQSQERTLKKYPIYENLAYKSSLGDELILANWDKIKEELRREYK